MRKWRQFVISTTALESAYILAKANGPCRCAATSALSKSPTDPLMILHNPPIVNNGITILSGITLQLRFRSACSHAIQQKTWIPKKADFNTGHSAEQGLMPQRSYLNHSFVHDESSTTPTTGHESVSSKSQCLGHLHLPSSDSPLGICWVCLAFAMRMLCLACGPASTSISHWTVQQHALSAGAGTTRPCHGYTPMQKAQQWVPPSKAEASQH